MHTVINKSFSKHFSKYAVSTQTELIEIVFCLKSFPYPSDSSHLSSTSLSKFYSLWVQDGQSPAKHAFQDSDYNYLQNNLA